MASLEDIRVQLIGDTAQYQRSMQVAAQVTQATGMTIEQALGSAMQTLTALTLQTAAGQQRLTREVTSVNRSLMEQALTYGMTARQAKIALAEMHGADPDTLRRARVADAYLTRRELEAAQIKATTQAEASLAAQKQRATEQAMRDSQRLELADNRRIHNKIEAETKAVLAAARARESQEAREKASMVERGGGLLGQAFEFAIETVKKAVEEFSNFDLAMINSTAIMKVTTEEVRMMRQSILEMHSVFSSTEIAQALYYLASAGMDSSQSLAALPAVLNFATAGAMSLGNAANYAVSATSALGLASKDVVENLRNMTRVMDMVTRASKLSLGSTEQYAKALTRDAASAIKTYNIELSTGIALLTAYHKAGLQGAIAGNAMGRSIRLIAGSTVTAGASQRAMGFHVFDQATGKMRDMADIIENLEEILSKHTEEAIPMVMKRLGFETLPQKAILPLVGQSQQIREWQAELKRSGGTAELIASRQMKAFTNQMTQMWNEIKKVGIELGSALMPVLSNSIGLVNIATTAWNALNATFRDTAVQTIVYTYATITLINWLSAIPALFAAIKAQVIALNAAFIANPFGMLAAAAAIFTVVAYQSISAIIGLKQAVRELNDEMQKSKELEIQIDAARKEGTAATIDRLKKVKNPEERDTKFSEVISSTRKDRDAQEKEAAKIAGRIADIGTTRWIVEGGVGWFTGRKTEFEELNIKLEETNRKLKTTKERLEQLEKAKGKPIIETDRIKEVQVEIDAAVDKVIEATRKLGLHEGESKVADFAARGGDVGLLQEAERLHEARRKEVELNKEFKKVMEDSDKKIAAHQASIGDTAREVQFYDFVLQGANQTQLTMAKSTFQLLDAFEKKEALLKKAIQTTKDNLTPEQKYAEAQAELKEMLNTIDPATGKAIINQETYNRAISKAAKELHGAKNAAQGFTAAALGSAEAYSRILAQADALAPIILPNIAGGGRIPERKPVYNIPELGIQGAKMGMNGVPQKNEQLSKIEELLKKIHSALDKKKSDIQVFDELIL